MGEQFYHFVILVLPTIETKSNTELYGLYEKACRDVSRFSVVTMADITVMSKVVEILMIIMIERMRMMTILKGDDNGDDDEDDDDVVDDDDEDDDEDDDDGDDDCNVDDDANLIAHSWKS